MLEIELLGRDESVDKARLFGSSLNDSLCRQLKFPTLRPLIYMQGNSNKLQYKLL